MLRVATWNINSVRLRIDQVARFVTEAKVDVLCLQEIKCLEDQFPRNAFVDMGMPHLKIAGQKGWHGVAIASRLPIEHSDTFQACKLGHARCVSARIAGRRYPELLHPRRRRRAGPGAEPEIRSQDGFLRAADRDDRGARTAARGC